MLKKISLLLIIILAVFVRSYHLDSLPPALFYDEIDAGYQAMIFNQNQTDYYGNKFPIHFHSFGDYRTSLYIYSVALTQKLVSNPEISTRLPSVIFGTTSILLIYLITGSLIPAFLLALSPWSIHYSRIAFEVSGMLMVILAGVYFWKKYLQNPGLIYLLLSVFLFGLSPYFYSTSKLFLIILAILIFTIWFLKIIKIKKSHLILASIFALFLMSPLLIDTFKGHAGFRFSYISIFSDPQISKTVDYQRYADVFTSHANQTGISPSFTSKLFHNKYVLVTQVFLKNYFSAFSTDFLLITGDQNPRHGFATHGLIYFVDYFLIFFGLINVIKNQRKNSIGVLFIWILIFAPIPYALTRDSLGPHATRLILMLPSLVYLSYQGILYLKYIFKWTIPIVIGIYLISFSSFWHYYNYDYPQESAMAWNSGMREAVIYTNNYPDNQIIFSDSNISFTSFLLFYHPYILAPKNSLETHLLPYSNDSFSGKSLDDKYFFGRVNWTNLKNIPKGAIFVAPASELRETPTHLKLIKTINKKYINSESFNIYSNE